MSEGRKFFTFKNMLIGALAVALIISLRSGRGKGETAEIGQIDLVGPIFASEPWMSLFDQAERTEDLKVLILKIDSPGGFVGSSQELHRRVQQFRARKNIPVIVSVENACASGAYYVACGADQIVANPGAVIGSIGVALEMFNVHELLARFGVKDRTFVTGKYKDAGSPTKSLTPEQEKLEREYFEKLIHETLDQFVGHIASAREMDTAAVRALANGSVYTGEESVRLGLIDSIGNHVDAIALAAEAAGLDTGVIHSPRRFDPEPEEGWLSQALFGKSASWIKRMMASRFLLTSRS